MGLTSLKSLKLRAFLRTSYDFIACQFCLDLFGGIWSSPKTGGSNHEASKPPVPTICCKQWTANSGHLQLGLRRLEQQRSSSGHWSLGFLFEIQCLPAWQLPWLFLAVSASGSTPSAPSPSAPAPPEPTKEAGSPKYIARTGRVRFRFQNVSAFDASKELPGGSCPTITKTHAFLCSFGACQPDCANYSGNPNNPSQRDGNCSEHQYQRKDGILCDGYIMR